MTDTCPDVDRERPLLPRALHEYFRRRRAALITELRELDALLGLPQTIPPRRR
jgi:hypothetical protein